ncbi:hypothetical protein GGI42DRAFT_320520 [Trichoderma sp. SZMC 28013]
MTAALPCRLFLSLTFSITLALWEEVQPSSPARAHIQSLHHTPPPMPVQFHFLSLSSSLSSHRGVGVAGWLTALFFGGVGFARLDQAIGLRLRVSQPNRRGYRCATNSCTAFLLHCTALHPDCMGGSAV